MTFSRILVKNEVLFALEPCKWLGFGEEVMLVDRLLAFGHIPQTPYLGDSVHFCES